jgi:hypothetical protein
MKDRTVVLVFPLPLPLPLLPCRNVGSNGDDNNGIGDSGNKDDNNNYIGSGGSGGSEEMAVTSMAGEHR